MQEGVLIQQHNHVFFFDKDKFNALYLQCTNILGTCYLVVNGTLQTGPSRQSLSSSPKSIAWGLAMTYSKKYPFAWYSKVPLVVSNDFQPSSVDPSWIRNLVYPFNPIFENYKHFCTDLDIQYETQRTFLMAMFKLVSMQ